MLARDVKPISTELQPDSGVAGYHGMRPISIVTEAFDQSMAI